MANEILVEDLTTNVEVDSNNVVTGDGVFDNLMETVTAHIKAQFDSNRITGTEYAEVYLGAVQAVLQQSTAILMQRHVLEHQADSAENDALMKISQNLEILASTARQDAESAKKVLLLQEQIDMSVAQQVTEEKKALLVVRQEKGFNDDAKQKLLKQILDSWSVMYSVSPAGLTTPETVSTGNIDTMTKDAMDALGVDTSNLP